MASYILRKIDPDLWSQVKTRADQQGHELRGLLLRFLRAYASGLSIDAVDPVTRVGQEDATRDASVSETNGGLAAKGTV